MAKTSKLIAASPRAFDLRWDPPVKVEDLQQPVFFGAVAVSPRKGVIAKAKWGDETLYLLDRGMST
jgi:hypothetical protein